jgi:hypothetical protein
MKHRSVIAFVIVAAALFSLPQLSHDLSALKGEVGALVHRELLYAFLNMPAGEPTAAAAPVVRPAETLLASCPKGKSGTAVTRSGRSEANGRAEGQSAVQSAMLGDPVNDPINHMSSARIEKAAGRAVESPAELKVETEVAMIVPPDGGIDPRGLASALAPSDVARLEAQQFRAEAQSLRVAYAAGARFDAQSPEWQRATGEAVRKLNISAGALELRVLRDGSKTKVLKFKCGECPATAPRLTRLPRQVAVTVPLPEPVAPFAPFDTVSE